MKPCGSSPSTALQARLATQHGERHAVHVAGGRGERRVEVRMGVEPKHEQLAPRLRRVPRHAADRSHRQAVIAAKHDRGPPGARRGVGLPRQQSRPGRHVGEPMRPAFRGRRIDARMGKHEIAPILDIEAEIAERFDDPRRSQHRGPHRGACNAGARFDRRAENGDRLSGRPAPLAFGNVFAAVFSVQDPPP